MLVGEKEFMKTIKGKDTPCFRLVSRQKKEIVTKGMDSKQDRNVGPKEVKELLDQYEGLVVSSKP